MILRFLFCNAAFSSSPLIFCLNSAAVAAVCSDSWVVQTMGTVQTEGTENRLCYCCRSVAFPVPANLFGCSAGM